jgi:hypothetical protein
MVRRLERIYLIRTISTVVAHFLHTEGVTSSNLVSSILSNISLKPLSFIRERLYNDH